ncbi:MAG: S8 family serine peptidase [Candidatus Cloacimonetes bacterium]|nr:S8 family serine peptidase [Candidatus Cloacimonadota bacterium]
MKILIALVMLLPVILFASDYDSRQMIIKTTEPCSFRGSKTGLRDFDNYIKTYKPQKIKSILKKGDNRYYLINVANEIDWSSFENLRFSGIEYIQPNYINELFMNPNDPKFSEQYLSNVKIPDVWDYTTGNKSVIIASIDSGLHFEHPDLLENIFINQAEIPDNNIDDDGNGFVDDWRGWDFVDAPEFEAEALGDYLEEDNDPTDEYNHGTHVAGIIAATSDNNEGIAGICWDVNLLVIRAGFSTTGGGFLQDDDAAAGLIYAADMGANVISLSWGDVSFSPIIADACEYAYERGCIIVAAAGNTYTYPLMYPAKLSTTISVGAVDSQNQRAGFSSYGLALDLVAPGVGVLSTFDVTEDNFYKEQSGTSMSAPFVAGAVGLLLSVEPNLSFESVKTRLISSATSIGSAGHDIEYGYGLLNAYKLLTNTDYPKIEITSPNEYDAFSQEFDIVGTVQSTDFNYFTVMYNTEKNPEGNGVHWKNVNNHSNNPYEYRDEVVNDVIATFDILGISTNLKEYVIRVKVSYSNKTVELRKHIYIDQTEPVFIDTLTSVMTRFDNEIQNYYIQSVFNEPVYLSLDCIGTTGTYTVNSTVCDSIQILKLPESLLEGEYTVNYQATNYCGLSTSGSLPFPIQINYHAINVNSFTQTIIGNEIVATAKNLDFDNNGKLEFLAYERTEDGDSLGIYEVNGSCLVKKHAYDFFLQPHDIGNSNGFGLEFIGVTGDQAKLYETESGYYPHHNFLATWNDVYGANMFDYINNNNDGYDEVILLQDITENQITRKKITVHSRLGDIFTENYQITNPSPTFFENRFANKMAFGNVNGNSIPDMLVGDSDGDIMLFEGNERKWASIIPVPSAYFLAIGDFTGHTDDLEDFVAGGFVCDPTNLAKSFAFFNFYTYSAADTTYHSMGYVSIDNVSPSNSILSVDITGDGTEEVVLSFPPNIYIIDYIDENNDGNFAFKPIWMGESVGTMQNVITAAKKNSFESGYIITNISVNGETKSSLIKVSGTEFSLPTPNRFYVEPLNETSVSLRWDECSLAENFNIYRKKDGIEEQITNISTNSYTDVDLIPGDTLFYQISMVNSQHDPEESLPTLWKQAVPSLSPKLISVEMYSSFEIKLIFDQELRNDAIMINNYVLNNDFGFPNSVNFIQNKKGLLFHYTQQLLDPEQNENILDYQFEIINLHSSHNVAFQDDYYPGNIIPITYRPDMIPPEIIGATKYDKKSVKISFSEPIIALSAEDMDNYDLILPPNDKNNSIYSVNYFENQPDDYYVILKLVKDPIKSNQEYFLKVDNLYDVAGNKITNDGNKCEFTLNEIVKLEDMIVAPNPFKTKEHNSVKFYFPLDKSGKIYIYDLSGDLVYTDDIKKLNSFESFYTWNGRNNANNRVSSGIYIYVVQLGDDITRGKIAIIN